MGFVEDNAPRHVELQRLKTLEDDNPAKGFAKFLGTFVATAPIPTKSKDLFAIYAPKDLRVLERDVEERKDHYSDENKETLRKLLAGMTTTAGQRTELLMSWLRHTTKKPVDLVRKITADRHDDVEEDSPGTFEDQNLGAGDKILI